MYRRRAYGHENDVYIVTVNGVFVLFLFPLPPPPSLPFLAVAGLLQVSNKILTVNRFGTGLSVQIYWHRPTENFSIPIDLRVVR
jgi:hypothetical protein